MIFHENLSVMDDLAIKELKTISLFIYLFIYYM